MHAPSTATLLGAFALGALASVGPLGPTLSAVLAIAWGVRAAASAGACLPTLLSLAGLASRAATCLETALLPPPAVVARRLAAALSASVDAALADLGVPEALADMGRATAAGLAARLGLPDATPLFRLLRAGAATGVVGLAGGGGDADPVHTVVFRPTRLTTGLATTPAGAVARVHAAHLGPAYAALAAGVRCGEHAYTLAHGQDFWSRLGADARLDADFSAAMAAGERLVSTPALAAAFPWPSARTIIDVGGANGSFLARLLALAGPDTAGILFDRPAVVRAARQGWRPSRAAVSFAAGDMFEAATLPRWGAGDVCVLRFICHDWSDDDAVTILRGLRSAVVEGEKGGGSRRPPTLALFELVLPPAGRRPAHPYAVLSDINMLAAVRGGRERKEREWEAVLRAGGWSLARVAPVGLVSVLEAVPAAVGGAADEE